MTSGTTRGAVVGAVVAGGAAVAHGWAGGTVTAGPVLLALVVSVLTARVVLRPGRVEVARVGLLAVAVQALWHFLLGAPFGAPSASHDHLVQQADRPDAAAMIGAHLLVATLTVALATGADLALLELARAFVDRLIPAMPVAPATTPRPGVPLGRWGRPSSTAPRTVAARGPPDLLRPFLPAALAHPVL